MKKFPENPTSIVRGLDSEFSEWVKSIEAIDHGSFHHSGVSILAASPGEQDASLDGEKVGRFLRSTRIGASFRRALEEDLLIDPEAMLNGEYGDGMKEDVDTVLQLATYREIIWE